VTSAVSGSGSLVMNWGQAKKSQPSDAPTGDAGSTTTSAPTTSTEPATTTPSATTATTGSTSTGVLTTSAVPSPSAAASAPTSTSGSNSQSPSLLKLYRDAVASSTDQFLSSRAESKFPEANKTVGEGSQIQKSRAELIAQAAYSMVSQVATSDKIGSLVTRE